MRNKLLAALICVIMSAAVTAPYAEAAKSISDLKEEMEDREQERKETEAEINSKKGERDERIEERNSLDLQITALVSDIDAVEVIIDEKQAAIEEKNEEIGELNQVIEESNDKLKERMKIMYEYGSASYLEIILDAKGLSDFFSRISIVKDIVNHDKELIDTYVNSKTELEAAKNVIQLEQKEQFEAKTILEDKKSELQDAQEQKEALISELNSDIDALEEQEQKAEEDYNSLKAELEEALAEQERQRKSSSSSASAASFQGSGQFLWPVESSRRITSYFGLRDKPNARATSNHRGIDVGAAAGTNVLAAESGTVVTAGYNSSYGNYVTINHGGGYVTLYAHNSRLLVSKGDTVTRGQVIAKVGSTGNSTGPHVHFEIMLNGVCQNPLNYVS